MATSVTLTSADGTTWTVPAGVTSLQGDITGNGSCGGVNANGEGGGAGGAFSRVAALSVTPGSTITINWGSVGTPGNAATAIWFSKTGSQPTSVSEGGLADGGGAAGNGITTPATGGLAANSIGDTKNDGGSGAVGSVPQLRGGGGGAPGTLAGSGASGSGITGATGAGNGGANTANGTNATQPGCGGGGGGPNGGNSGNGAAGQIVFTYTAVLGFGLGLGFGSLLGGCE